MTPYYDKGGITIYHADCRDVLPSLTPGSVDLVLTDPPYGIGVLTNYRERGRGAAALCNNYPPIHGDDTPFDPSPLLRFKRLVLFGANHYADKLPPSASWLVWDKLNGATSKREVGFNDQADAELIWTNIGGPVRIIRHRWMGMLKDSERQDNRRHPTQKPVAVIAKIIGMFCEPGGLVLDPFMGSGTTLRAAKDAGLKAVGIEIEERYCEVAARRLEQEVFAWGETP